ncbi:MAG: hypothetical protein ABEH88_04950 [Halobacteriales archaeon]
MRLPTAVRRVHYGGLAVAVVGFLASTIIAQAIPESMGLPTVLSGLVPLSIGLGLSVFGVALAVGTFGQAYVTTTARWCLIGTATMVLVFLVTAVGSGGSMGGMFRASEKLVANVLLAGAVGGVLIGDRSAKNRRQRREIRRQANRGIVLNRILRDEVLNAVAVVNGYAPFLSDPETAPEETGDAIEEAAGQIERTVEEVGAIAAEPGDGSLRPTDPSDHVREQIEAIRSLDFDPEIRVSGLAKSTPVQADERLGLVVRGLLRHATGSTTGEEIRVTMSGTTNECRIEVVYPGSPLDPKDRALLQSGELPEYDDPTVDFDLQTAWLLVDRYGGRIDAQNGSGETRITVSLPRAAPESELESAVGAATEDLIRVSAAGLVAGVVMGLTLWGLGDGLAIIGALYGIESPVVGWITHLFHSVVFALLFVALTSWPPLRDRTDTVPGATVLGVVWAVVLALGAAGVLMPVWLGAVGVDDVVFPNVTATAVLGHMLWGLVLGTVYGLLREYNTVFDVVGERVVRALDISG